jgi:hypothetical protein
MNDHLDDATLAAYVLNEIGDAERPVIEAALDTDPAARQAVDAFRAAAQLATEAYHEEPRPALTDGQRQSLLAQAGIREPAGSASGKAPTERKPRWRRWGWRISVAAAGLVLILGITVLLGKSPHRAKQAVVQTGEDAYFGRPTSPTDARQFREERTRLGVKADFDTSNFVELKEGLAFNGIWSDKGVLDLNGDGTIRGDLLAPKAGIQQESHDLVLSYGTKLSQGDAKGSESSAETPQGADAAVKAETSAIPEGQAPDRYLIRNASLELEAEDAEAAAQQLQEAVHTAGGYVSGLDKRVDGLGRPSFNLTLRVPADRLDGSLDAIRTLGRIIHEQVTTEDVTEEYVDLDARLRNLKKAEERLLEHLRNAILIDSTLKVEQELTRVREQIERFEGRLRFLGHRVRYSTIQVQISQKPKAEQMAPVDTFSPAHVLTQAVRSLVEFGQTLLTKTIWLAVWSPVWALGIAVVIIAYRRIRRRVRPQQ